MTILQTKDLKKYYGSGDTQVKALDGVDLTVEQGEFVAIVGTSSSGKSTLLHMLGGLDRPTSGSVTVDGKNIFSLKDEALTIFRRRKIGFVFQSFNLVPVLTVRENIVLPIQLDGGKVDERYVGEVVTALGLEKKLNSLPGQLSGGQQQRVAIARALIKKPDVLLLDEPLSNLDARLRMEMRAEIRRIQQESKVTTIFVTHDQEEAMSITDEIVLMRQGVVQQIANPHEMYLNPANSFVASFMGNPPISYVDVQVDQGWAVLQNGLRIHCGSNHSGPARLGIRPEAWSLGDDLSVTLTDVEMRGQDQVISFLLADQPIRAILNAEEYVRPGQEIRVHVSEKRCYLFDSETGVRL